jgi:hypothetical protein
VTGPDDRYAYPPAYYAPGWQPPAPKWDGPSVAALVTGVVGLGPVPVVLGAVGVARTRRRGTRGRGLAWTGLALGVLAIVGWAALGGLVWLLLRPLPADVDGPRYAVPSQVAEGNCLARLPDDGEVWAVRVVPCADAHAARVVAVATLTDPPSGQRRLDDAAADLCRQQAPGESLVVWAPVPGHATVTCLVRTDATADGAGTTPTPDPIALPAEV